MLSNHYDADGNLQSVYVDTSRSWEWLDEFDYDGEFGELKEAA